MFVNLNKTKSRPEQKNIGVPKYKDGKFFETSSRDKHDIFFTGRSRSTAIGSSRGK